KVGRNPTASGENRSEQLRSRQRRYTKRKRGAQMLLKVAKVVQKRQLAVGDWLPLQRSQLQNNQPKGPGNLRDTYGKNGRELKGKRVRENELRNQEEDKENRKGNVKKRSKKDNQREKLGVEKEEKVSLIEQIKRHNGLKLEALEIWAKENCIDIVGIAETNITEKEGFFLLKNSEIYKAYWTETDQKKKKGSG
ncbi:17404_t:CDS:2, partial [Gigaspora rosea]